MTTCDTFVLFIANLARTPWASAFRFSSTKTGVLEAMGRLSKRVCRSKPLEFWCNSSTLYLSTKCWRVLFIEFDYGHGPGGDACISRVWAVADAV